MDLFNNTHRKIEKICNEGNTLADKGKFIIAREKFLSALDMIPSPKYNQSESVWIYTAIGDVSYLAGNYEDAYIHLNEAIKCQDGLGNPFILLRLGECFYEMGDIIAPPIKQCVFPQRISCVLC